MWLHVVFVSNLLGGVGGERSIIGETGILASGYTIVWPSSAGTSLVISLQYYFITTSAGRITGIMQESRNGISSVFYVLF